MKLVLFLFLWSISIFVVELFILIDFERGLQFIDDLFLTNKYINW